MKKIIVLVTIAMVALSSCSLRLYEEEKTDPYYNTIYRGMTTHNHVVLSNQHEQIMKMNADILANQEKILENQEKIIKLLEEK